MASSFQSTSGESFRRPVNTFVQPVTATRKSSLADLAEILEVVNPVLTKFAVKKEDERNQAKMVEGQEFILQADDEELKNAIKTINERDGSRAKKDFLGNNRFFQIGAERQIAINLGNAAELNTEKFFKNYTVEVPNKSGGVDYVPLSDFDVNSAVFDKALSDFNRTSLINTKGIRPSILNQYFLPKQNAALKKVFDRQVSNSADKNIAKYSSIISSTSLQNFRNIKKYDKNIELNIIDNDGFITGYDHAVNLTQEDIDYAVSLGLSEVVSPTALVKTIKKNAYTILNEFEEGNISWVEAQEELDDYIDFMSDLKVGPKGRTKTGVEVQKTLGEFLEQGDDILNLKKDIYKQINDLNKEESDLIEANKKKDIQETFKTINYSISPSDKDYAKVLKQNVATLKNLTKRYPNLKKYIVEEYNLRNDNIDLWWDRFTRDYNNGKFGDRDNATTKINSFMALLGSTASDEDRKRYKEALTLINKENPQGVFASHPQFKTTLQQVKEALREDNNSGYTIVKFGYTNAFNDLSNRYRNKIDAWAVKEYPNESAKEEAKNKILNFIKEEGLKIVTGDYEFEDKLLEEFYNRANQPKKFNKKQLENIKGLAEGGPVKKDEPVLVGEEGPEILVPKTDGLVIPNDVLENTTQIVNDVVQSMNGVDEEPEKITIVGEEETNGIKRFEANFPIFYKLAKEAGHKFPEVTAAQAMLETSNGADPSAVNNYLGLKATKSETKRGESTLQNTTENEGDKVISIQDNFKNFNSLIDMMNQYKKEWNDDFMDRKGIVNVNTAEEAARLLQANVYATDPDYADKIIQIIKDAKRNPPLF
tara:strand:- start:271 stop:2736 length:2466 start_codon:yes stop_codon:yes gene_type:complete